MSDRPITKLPWGLKNDKLAPGSMKTITETKIKAFQQGAMNIAKKTLSKRELEEMKRKQQEEEAAEVYKDFVASFEDPNKIGKTFVKGTTIQAGVKTTETQAADRGRLYKPSSKLQELAETFSSFKSSVEKSTAAPATQTEHIVSLDLKKPPRKQQEKRKTNLEAFKDELKRIQEERDRRHEIKKKIKEQEESGRKSRFEPYIPPDGPIDSELSLDDAAQERYSSDDPNTTNIFLSNLSRTLNEMEIMEMFGQFGPLASVKIMYPRSDEERARGSNCGFVAFMNRRDAEVAIAELDGFEVGGLRLRLSWGKQVHIPLQPVYVPPSLVEANLHPPPKSGYPFNAQPPPNFPRYPDVIKPTRQQIKQALENSVIKVIVPTDRKLLCLIHRTIEFVIREGPKFESLLMQKEKENPQFRFLFDNDLPTHIYYRWKLFSILQGDSVYQWRTSHFKMFKHGSLWIPPSVPLSKHDTIGSYDESFERAKAELSDRKNKFNNQMQEILKSLTTERDVIADAMIYSIEHAHVADEIANAICRSLATPESTCPQKVAHLFLISDILHNCSFGVFNASSYRRVFEERLPSVFESLRLAGSEIGSKVKAEQFKSKVMACFRAWEDWNVYPSDMLIKLQNIFLGFVKNETYSTGLSAAAPEGGDESSAGRTSAITKPDAIDDSDIDGQPIDESEEAEYVASSLHQADKKIIEQNEDIDGEPLDASDIDDGAPRFTEKGLFVSSKWETVDPETVRIEAATNPPPWNEIRQLDADQIKDARPLDMAAVSIQETINPRTELRSRCNSFDSSLSVSRSSSTTANDRTGKSPSCTPEPEIVEAKTPGRNISPTSGQFVEPERISCKRSTTPSDRAESSRRDNRRSRRPMDSSDDSDSCRARKERRKKSRREYYERGQTIGRSCSDDNLSKNIADVASETYEHKEARKSRELLSSSTKVHETAESTEGSKFDITDQPDHFGRSRRYAQDERRYERPQSRRHDEAHRRRRSRQSSPRDYQDRECGLSSESAQRNRYDRRRYRDYDRPSELIDWQTRPNYRLGEIDPSNNSCSAERQGERTRDSQFISNSPTSDRFHRESRRR